VSAVIYAIGDIHGEKAMLDEMRRRILVDAEYRPGDKLAVYLGGGALSCGVLTTNLERIIRVTAEETYG